MQRKRELDRRVLKISLRWGINALPERQSDGTCPAVVLMVEAQVLEAWEYVTLTHPSGRLVVE